jgi:branched-chain amino acid transport system substrate-binding protein
VTFKLSFAAILTGLLTAGFVTSSSLAQSKYDPGANDIKIKIGNTVAYTAYFKLISDEGGSNGRKINFISYDDANTPPKTVEQTRKLVESDEVNDLASNKKTPRNIEVLADPKSLPELI